MFESNRTSVSTDVLLSTLKYTAHTLSSLYSQLSVLNSEGDIDLLLRQTTKEEDDVVAALRHSDRVVGHGARGGDGLSSTEATMFRKRDGTDKKGGGDRWRHAGIIASERKEEDGESGGGASAGNPSVNDVGREGAAASFVSPDMMSMETALSQALLENDWHVRSAKNQARVDCARHKAAELLSERRQRVMAQLQHVAFSAESVVGECDELYVQWVKQIVLTAPQQSLEDRGASSVDECLDAVLRILPILLHMLTIFSNVSLLRVRKCESILLTFLYRVIISLAEFPSSVGHERGGEESLQQAVAAATRFNLKQLFSDTILSHLPFLVHAATVQTRQTSLLSLSGDGNSTNAEGRMGQKREDVDRRNDVFSSRPPPIALFSIVEKTAAADSSVLELVPNAVNLTIYDDYFWVTAFTLAVLGGERLANFLISRRRDSSDDACHEILVQSVCFCLSRAIKMCATNTLRGGGGRRGGGKSSRNASPTGRDFRFGKGGFEVHQTQEAGHNLDGLLMAFDEPSLPLSSVERVVDEFSAILNAPNADNQNSLVGEDEHRLDDTVSSAIPNPRRAIPTHLASSGGSIVKKGRKEFLFLAADEISFITHMAGTLSKVSRHMLAASCHFRGAAQTAPYPRSDGDGDFSTASHQPSPFLIDVSTVVSTSGVLALLCLVVSTIDPKALVPRRFAAFSSSAGGAVDPPLQGPIEEITRQLLGASSSLLSCVASTDPETFIPAHGLRECRQQCINAVVVLFAAWGLQISRELKSFAMSSYSSSHDFSSPNLTKSEFGFRKHQPALARLLIKLFTGYDPTSAFSSSTPYFETNFSGLNTTADVYTATVRENAQKAESTGAFLRALVEVHFIVRTCMQELVNSNLSQQSFGEAGGRFGELFYRMDENEEVGGQEEMPKNTSEVHSEGNKKLTSPRVRNDGTIFTNLAAALRQLHVDSSNNVESAKKGRGGGDGNGGFFECLWHVSLWAECLRIVRLFGAALSSSSDVKRQVKRAADAGLRGVAAGTVGSVTKSSPLFFGKGPILDPADAPFTSKAAKTGPNPQSKNSNNDGPPNRSQAAAAAYMAPHEVYWSLAVEALRCLDGKGVLHGGGGGSGEGPNVSLAGFVMSQRARGVGGAFGNLSDISWKNNPHATSHRMGLDGVSNARNRYASEDKVISKLLRRQAQGNEPSSTSASTRIPTLSTSPFLPSGDFWSDHSSWHSLRLCAHHRGQVGAPNEAGPSLPSTFSSTSRIFGPFFELFSHRKANAANYKRNNAAATASSLLQYYGELKVSFRLMDRCVDECLRLHHAATIVEKGNSLRRSLSLSSSENDSSDEGATAVASVRRGTPPLTNGFEVAGDYLSSFAALITKTAALEATSLGKSDLAKYFYHSSLQLYECAMEEAISQRKEIMQKLVLLSSSAGGGGVGSGRGSSLSAATESVSKVAQHKKEIEGILQKKLLQFDHNVLPSIQSKIVGAEIAVGTLIFASAPLELAAYNASSFSL